MDAKTLKDFEYEEQIFEFSSQLFADNFKNFVHSKLDESIDSLVSFFRGKLINECKNPDEFNNKLQEMKVRLKSEYKKSLDSENILEKVSKCLNIPDHVLLKEDLPVRDGLNMNISEIEKEIDDLKKRYKALTYLKKVIHEEVKMAHSTICILDSIIDENDFNFKILDTTEMLKLAKSNSSLIKQ